MRLGITTRVGCAVDCSYCPQKKFRLAYSNRSSVRQISLDTFSACLDKLPREMEIYFAGFCEPWLNPECTQLVLRTGEKGFSVTVYTTLVGMRPSDIDAIESVPFKDFKVHIPSADSSSEKILVDTGYLAVLDRLRQSRIKTLYSVYGLEPHPDVAALLEGVPIKRRQPHSRAGNLSTAGTATPAKRRGVIRCGRLRHNILLPNGDVALCCNDWGLQHVLGNLLNSSYETLFESESFAEVVRGQCESGSNVLCRSCADPSLVDVDWQAKFSNCLLPAWKAGLTERFRRAFGCAGRRSPTVKENCT